MLPGWLYATTRNVAVDFIRAEQRRRAREQEASTMHELTSTLPTDAAWDQVRPMLDEVMDELSDADREIVVLRFFARRPFADIGAALHLTEDAARMRTERALEKLHVLLTRRGITSTGSALGIVLANQAVIAAPAGLLASVTSTALGSAATAGTLGFLSFMSMTKIITATLGVVALLAVGTVVYEAKVVDASSAALDATRRERDNLQTSLSRAEKRAQQSDDALTAARKELNDLHAAAAK